MAPAEIICISITPGKTRAMPASASVPNREMNQVSIRPVDACATMTRTFGHANSSNVDKIGAFRSRLVRGLNAGLPDSETTGSL